jgi:hypothetical protein
MRLSGFDLLIRIDVEAWQLIFLSQQAGVLQLLACTLFQVAHL